MSTILESVEKVKQTTENDNYPTLKKPFLINVKMYHLMIEKGILNKYHKVELIDGKIYEKYTSEPFRFSVEMFDAMIKNGILNGNHNVELLDNLIMEKNAA